VGPVSFAENAGAIRSVDSGEESGGCGDAGETASAAEDAATSRACSSVARLASEAAQAEDVAAAVTVIEEALAELDAGRIDAAKARLKAFVAATRSACGA
jgi:hypothetical protein